MHHGVGGLKKVSMRVHNKKMTCSRDGSLETSMLSAFESKQRVTHTWLTKQAVPPSGRSSRSSVLAFS